MFVSHCKERMSPPVDPDALLSRIAEVVDIGACLGFDSRD